LRQIGPRAARMRQTAHVWFHVRAENLVECDEKSMKQMIARKYWTKIAHLTPKPPPHILFVIFWIFTEKPYDWYWTSGTPRNLHVLKIASQRFTHCRHSPTIKEAPTNKLLPKTMTTQWQTNKKTMGAFQGRKVWNVSHRMNQKLNRNAARTASNRYCNFQICSMITNSTTT
jgi:Ni,Fe-hydrogenase III large subunit